MGPSNKLINTTISVMICMIFTLRLPKTKRVYISFLSLQYFKILFLRKSFFPYFNWHLLTKWSQSLFFSKCIFTIALSLYQHKFSQNWTKYQIHSIMGLPFSCSAMQPYWEFLEFRIVIFVMWFHLYIQYWYWNFSKKVS